jgi:hypothetical protein
VRLQRATTDLNRLLGKAGTGQAFQELSSAAGEHVPRITEIISEHTGRMAEHFKSFGSRWLPSQVVVTGGG